MKNMPKLSYIVLVICLINGLAHLAAAEEPIKHEERGKLGSQWGRMGGISTLAIPSQELNEAIEKETTKREENVKNFMELIRKVLTCEIFF